MVELVAMGARERGAAEMPDPLAVRAHADRGAYAHSFRANVADQRALRTDAVQKMGWHEPAQDIGKTGCLSPERAC